MGVAYYLIDLKDTSRCVGAHALGHGYKKKECWHDEEKNKLMIEFLNRSMGGEWKLVEEGEYDELRNKNLGYRKAVRCYACKIGMTTWRWIRFHDLCGDAKKRRYVKLMDEEEERKVLQTLMLDGQLRPKLKTLDDVVYALRRYFMNIQICNAIDKLKKDVEHLDACLLAKSKMLVSGTVKAVNELLAPKKAVNELLARKKRKRKAKSSAARKKRA